MNNSKALPASALTMLMVLVDFDDEICAGRRAPGDRMWVNERMLEQQLGGVSMLVELVHAELVEVQPGLMGSVAVHAVTVLPAARAHVDGADAAARSRYRSAIAELAKVLQVVSAERVGS
jgi:hypothetical protein